MSKSLLPPSPSPPYLSPLPITNCPNNPAPPNSPATGCTGLPLRTPYLGCLHPASSFRAALLILEPPPPVTPTAPFSGPSFQTTFVPGPQMCLQRSGLSTGLLLRVAPPGRLGMLYPLMLTFTKCLYFSLCQEDHASSQCSPSTGSRGHSSDAARGSWTVSEELPSFGLYRLQPRCAERAHPGRT